jgi:hypothetical protein
MRGDLLGGQLGAAPAVPMPEGMGQQPFGAKDAARACRAQRYGIKPCPLSNSSLGRNLAGNLSFEPSGRSPRLRVLLLSGHLKYRLH